MKVLLSPNQRFQRTVPLRGTSLATLGAAEPVRYAAGNYMNRTVAVLLVFLTAPAIAAVVDRKPYQAVISEQFPGFEILKREQFQSGWREALKDGENGALLVGRFNFDAYSDFAAYLAPSGTPSSGRYTGKYVECLGTADRNKYHCKALDRPLYLPLEENLELIKAGVQECMGEANEPEWVKVTAEIDSIGEYSEKGGGFSIRRKDGSEFICVTSD